MENNIKNQSTSDTDFVVSGASEGGYEILNSVRNSGAFVSDSVVYGVYNNENAGLSVKLNDFLIDRSGVGLKDKSYFFHMLAVMVDAGIPVVTAIKSLAVRTENPRLGRVLNTLAYNCEHGSTLADSMSRFETVFDESEIGIVRAGEETGKLNTMLFKLSSQLDKNHDLSLKLWGAAVYPIAVVCVLLIVAVGMLVWVFPTLMNLLTQSGVTEDKLPLATMVLLNLQRAVTGYWWAIIAGALVAYGLFTIYVGSDYGSYRWDYFKLKFPIIGGLLRKLYVLRFVGLVGLLIEAGLPVIRAIAITGGAISNKLYKLKIQEVMVAVRDGRRISDSLGDVDFLFPAEVVQMLNVGEASASLGKVAEKIADQYQREIDNGLKKISSVFEPVMILFVGLFVALLALAIMAPIFNLSNVVGS
ncbi:MAG: type II secretion system F family protein [Candidatus Peregrinibacteria bacterium]|nr:type II secretion system F family protein [Candidatus Peregrinibacteria bacterium]